MSPTGFPFLVGGSWWLCRVQHFIEFEEGAGDKAVDTPNNLADLFEAEEGVEVGVGGGQEILNPFGLDSLVSGVLCPLSTRLWV